MLKSQKKEDITILSQLSTGSTVDIEVMMPASSKRLKTEFVGHMPGQYLILNCPSSKRLGAAFEYVKEGTYVVVRAVVEQGDGHIVAFKSMIKAVTAHPTKLIFLFLPRVVQSYQLREQVRVPTLIPATFSTDSHCDIGVIKDISLSGLQFDLQNDDAQLDENLKQQDCEILLEGKQNQQFKLNGEVCRVKQTDDLVKLGIKLKSDQTFMETIMKEYLIDLSVLQADQKAHFKVSNK